MPRQMRSPTPAEQYPFAGQQLPCYVAGEFVRSGRSFPNVSPVNGRVIASVSEADAALVDRAVQAGRAALRGPWGRLTVPERCALLRKVVRIGRVSSQRMGKAPESRPDGSELGIERGRGRHCAPCG